MLCSDAVAGILSGRAGVAAAETAGRAVTRIQCRHTIGSSSVPSANNVVSARESGTFQLAGRTVHRLGFGAMRITGPGIWGEPADRDEALAVLRRAVELGVDFIDTADSYGPGISEELIAAALYPYPADLVIA